MKARLKEIWKTRKDLLLHIACGFVIGFAIAFWRPGEALAAVILAGAGKELYDKYIKKTEADGTDFVATLFGGVIGVAFSVLFQNLIA